MTKQYIIMNKARFCNYSKYSDKNEVLQDAAGLAFTDKGDLVVLEVKVVINK